MLLRKAQQFQKEVLKFIEPRFQHLAVKASERDSVVHSRRMSCPQNTQETDNHDAVDASANTLQALAMHHRFCRSTATIPDNVHAVSAVQTASARVNPTYPTLSSCYIGSDEFCSHVAPDDVPALRIIQYPVDA
jgi:hypothetical protein